MAALLAVALVVVGVAVWPTPKEALAVDTTFKAEVNWNGNPPAPGEIVLTVYIYDADWIIIQEFGMNYIATVGWISDFQAVKPWVEPGIHWGVFLFNESEYEFEQLLINDGDDLNVGGNNELDVQFRVAP